MLHTQQRKRQEYPRQATCGIYVIRNKVNGKVYVGSSVNIEGRWSTHRSTLRRGIHANEYLQHAWLKDGEAAFEFEIVEVVERTALKKSEQAWMEKLQATTRSVGYNISLDTEAPMRGRTLSPEHRQALHAAGRAASLGRVYSDETKQLMSRAKLGKLQPGKNVRGAANTKAKTYLVTTPDGEELVVTSMTQFCRERNLNAGAVCELARPSSRSKHCHGYKVQLHPKLSEV